MLSYHQMRILPVVLLSLVAALLVQGSSGGECVACSKQLPVCQCGPGQRCVQHPQTCQRCAYAECVLAEGTDSKGPVNKSAGQQKQSLPPIPVDIDKQQQVRVLTSQDEEDGDDRTEGIFCAQVVPECRCQAPDEVCRIVPQSKFRCAWAACYGRDDGCIHNCPAPQELCQSCHRLNMTCSIRLPDNCRSCATEICKRPPASEHAKCALCTGDEVCEGSLVNGRPVQKCLPLAGI
jgi:hypothetical protein